MADKIEPNGVENDCSSTDNMQDAVENKPESQPQPDSAESMAPVYSVFSKRTKIFMVIVTVMATMFSPFSSFIYLPAITPIADEYRRTVADINLSVTLYQVMQAVAPLFFGDLSDQLGRRPVYMVTFVIYIGANVGLALQHSYAALLVLRALQSTGSSATVAIGNAVVADFTTSAERGAYVTAVQASIMFAPALAPVLGGILTQYLGWRSTFWFLVIAAGVFIIVYVLFVPETARNIVGDGSIPPPRLNRSLLNAYQKKCADSESGNFSEQDQQRQQQQLPRKRRIPMPDLLAAVRIVLEKDVGPLMIFTSLLVMTAYAMLVPLQDVIRVRYGFNDLQVGLCFIPNAIGSIAGSLVVGKLLNWNYARVARSVGVSPDRRRGDNLRHFPIERARLDLMWPWLILAVSMTIAWGWVIEANTSLAAPLVVLFFSGFGLNGPMSILTTLLVDLYPMNPGRVSSTFNLTRAALSAIGTAVVQYMINSWGYGYTYLFMGLIVLAASPSIWIVRHWGPQWREERLQRFMKESERGNI